MISFPRPGVQSDRVVLKGTKDYIEMAKQRIQESSGVHGYHRMCNSSEASPYCYGS